MGRLTWKEESGKWQVKGIPWEKLRGGEAITKEEGDILYGCLCKLKDYEDTGMSPDQVEQLQDKAGDMAEHVCDQLCRYPRKITDQEEMDKICEGCRVNIYLKRDLMK